MKNLRVTLAVLAVLTGSAFAVSTNANAASKLEDTIGYFAVDQNTPPAKLTDAENLGTDPGTAASHCSGEVNQCVAEFNADGSLITGTLINSNFQ